MQERWRGSSGDTHELDTKFNAEKFFKHLDYHIIDNGISRVRLIIKDKRDPLQAP